jgi:hypothetical protein
MPESIHTACAAKKAWGIFSRRALCSVCRRPQPLIDAGRCISEILLVSRFTPAWLLTATCSTRRRTSSSIGWHSTATALTSYGCMTATTVRLYVTSKVNPALGFSACMWRV